jgi:hypothetical protein
MEIEQPRVSIAKHGQTAEKQKAKNNLTRESFFTVTLNTNRAWKIDEEDPEKIEHMKQQREILKNMFESMFGDKKIVPKMLVQRDGKKGKILGVSSKATIEVGSDDDTNKNQLHLHGVVKVRHTRTDGKNSAIKIDLTAMRKTAKQLLGYERGCPYIKVKALPSARDYEAYMAKYL